VILFWDPLPPTADFILSSPLLSQPCERRTTEHAAFS